MGTLMEKSNLETKKLLPIIAYRSDKTIKERVSYTFGPPRELLERIDRGIIAPLNYQYGKNRRKNNVSLEFIAISFKAYTLLNKAKSIRMVNFMEK